jgi:hypothetical protein
MGGEQVAVEAHEAPVLGTQLAQLRFPGSGIRRARPLLAGEGGDELDEAMAVGVLVQAGIQER